MSRTLCYTGGTLDRVSDRRSDADWVAARLADPHSLFVPLWQGRVLVQGHAGSTPCAARLDRDQAAGLLAANLPWVLLGLDGSRAVFAVDLGEADAPIPSLALPGLALSGLALPGPHGGFEDLRSVAAHLPGPDAAMLAHARGLLHWRARHRFCGVCGAACAPSDAGNTLHCTGCRVRHFPRTDPAVIMLVTRGDRALLAHSHRFPTVVTYSTLAGFVEPGESLEEAVAREVREEVGLSTGAVRYHSSQPWPFPASVMVGFQAEALTDAVTIDPKELRDARWFSRDELRDHQRHGFDLPRGDSIARRLIADWIGS